MCQPRVKAETCLQLLTNKKFAKNEYLVIFWG